MDPVMRNPKVFGQRFFCHGGFGIFLEVFLGAIFMEKGKQCFGPRADVPALQERRWHLAVEGLPKLNVPSGRLPFRIPFYKVQAWIFLRYGTLYGANNLPPMHRTPLSTPGVANSGHCGGHERNNLESCRAEFPLDRRIPLDF